MTLAPNSGEFSYLHFRAVSAYISYISQISRIDSWLSSPELRAHDTGWTTKQISRRPTFSGRPSELRFCMVHFPVYFVNFVLLTVFFLASREDFQSAQVAATHQRATSLESRRPIFYSSHSVHSWFSVV